MEIRDAVDADIPQIIKLCCVLGRPKPQKDSESMFRKLVKKYISDPDKKILVVAINDVEIVGMVSVLFLFRLNHKSLEMYVPELVVAKKHQNQGIGKKLVSSCIFIAKQKKCHRIRLESGKHRTGSHHFYKKLGFQQNSLSFTKTI